MTIRQINAALIAPLLKLTGYRFSKAWRQEETVFKAFIYNYVICTVTANTKAG